MNLDKSLDKNLISKPIADIIIIFNDRRKEHTRNKKQKTSRYSIMGVRRHFSRRKAEDTFGIYLTDNLVIR